MSGKVVPGAGGSGRGDPGTAVPVPFSYEIPHTRSTTPIPGARIYPMSSPFSRTDTRTGLTRDGRVYAAGSGYLWASRDRGRTWTMRKLPVGTGGGFGILNDDVFIESPGPGAGKPDHGRPSLAPPRPRIRRGTSNFDPAKESTCTALE